MIKSLEILCYIILGFYIGVIIEARTLTFREYIRGDRDYLEKSESVTDLTDHLLDHFIEIKKSMSPNLVKAYTALIEERYGKK